MISISVSSFASWSTIFTVLTIACYFLKFYLKFAQKVKILKIHSYEFKRLEEDNLFYHIKNKMLYNIEQLDKCICVSLYKNPDGKFVTYDESKFIPISINSKQANEIIKFMPIDDGNFVYNQKTLLVYELSISEELLLINPYTSNNGYNCQYKDGNMLELRD